MRLATTTNKLVKVASRLTNKCPLKGAYYAENNQRQDRHPHKMAQRRLFVSHNGLLSLVRWTSCPGAQAEVQIPNP